MAKFEIYEGLTAQNRNELYLDDPKKAGAKAVAVVYYV